MENKEELKHEKSITDFFKKHLFEDWMTEDDYSHILNLSLLKMNTSIEKMNNELEIGIKNGYSIEFQFNIIEFLLKK